MSTINGVKMKFPAPKEDIEEHVKEHHPTQNPIEPGPHWLPEIQNFYLSPKDPTQKPTGLGYCFEDTTPLSEQASFSFFHTAGRILYSLRGRTSQAQFAKEIGESPSNFQDIVFARKKRGGSLNRVARWMLRWKEKGYRPVSLLVTSKSAIAVPEVWVWIQCHSDEYRVTGVGTTLKEAMQNAGVTEDEFHRAHGGPSWSMSVKEREQIGYPATIGIGTYFEDWKKSYEAISKGWM